MPTCKLHKHQRVIRFVTPDKESTMSTLWQEKEFEQICSRKLLTEKAADIEKTIAVKEHEREHYDFDPAMLYEGTRFSSEKYTRYTVVSSWSL